MKQNDILPPIFDQKIPLNERNRRQAKPSQKPVYSPRLITRKKQKKQNMMNPFSRRKVTGQNEANSVLRYMSIKRGQNQNDDNMTFLSDQNNMVWDGDQFNGQESILNLRFSRIHSPTNSHVDWQKDQVDSKKLTKQSSHQILFSKNLFEDIMNTSHQQEVTKSISNRDEFSVTGSSFHGTRGELVGDRMERLLEIDVDENNNNNKNNVINGGDDGLEDSASCYEKQQKSGLSLQTMSQSPNYKEVVVDQRVKMLMVMRENRTLNGDISQIKKQNQSLNQQNKRLKIKITELHHQLQTKTKQSLQSQHKMQQRLNEVQSAHKQRENELQGIIQETMNRLTKLQQQSQQQKNQQLNQQFIQLSQQIDSLNKYKQELQSQCQQKQLQLKQTLQQLTQTKSQLQERNNYAKCLQDVILQLNKKISQLKYLNDEHEKIIDQKDQAIEVLEEEKENYQRNVELYEEEIAQYQEKFSLLSNTNSGLYSACQLEARLEEMPDRQQNKLTGFSYHHSRMQRHVSEKLSSSFLSSFLPHNNSISQNQQRSQTQHQLQQKTLLITHLHQQITQLHSIICTQKQQNEKLKKQLSYKMIQVDFFKKNHYQHEKNTQEILSLKQKNKKLTKKLNRIIEDFQTYKEENQYKKSNQLNKVKSQDRFISSCTSPQAKEKYQSTITKKNVNKRENMHSPRSILNAIKKTKSTYSDSDDELSFKLSPEKY